MNIKNKCFGGKEESVMVKSKFVKEVLTAALALSLIMAPAVGASAGSVSGNSSSSVSGNAGAPASESDSSDEDQGSDERDREREREEEGPSIPSTSIVKVAGEYRTTAIKGAYMSETFAGTVVSTDEKTLEEAYGVEDAAQPYIRIYDISEKNTPAAMESAELAAESVGGSVIGAVNMEIGSLKEGEFTLFDEDGRKITMIFSIPQNQVREDCAYAMVCVRPGGTAEILSDLDTDANTVTFQTTGGLGAYVMIRYPAA